MSTELSGASDDLIEIDGDLIEEFQLPGEGETAIVGFSTGDVLRITYDDAGVWRIVPLVKVRPDSVTIVQAPEGDEDNYTDVATIVDQVKWAVCGTEWASPARTRTSWPIDV